MLVDIKIYKFILKLIFLENLRSCLELVIVVQWRTKKFEQILTHTMLIVETKVCKKKKPKYNLNNYIYNR
jgi:hypothetical protein